MASKETNYVAGTRVGTTDDGCLVIID